MFLNGFQWQQIDVSCCPGLLSSGHTGAEVYTTAKEVVMALQEEVTKHREDTASVDILDGAAILAVSPIVIPALLLGLRPVAKTFIKGSLFLTNMVKQFATPPSEARSNAVAEGRTATRTVSAPQLAGTRAEPPPQADTAGLERITGIGSKRAMLLKATGVSTVHDLAQWDPADLHAELTKINDKDDVIGLVPSLEQVTEWIAQAKREVV
jgi:predicted flap endonuclease-1-like 5' DNA nuclease